VSGLTQWSGALRRDRHMRADSPQTKDNNVQKRRCALPLRGGGELHAVRAIMECPMSCRRDGATALCRRDEAHDAFVLGQ
jgi:hypothetical protein